MELIRNGNKKSGICGEMADFTDSLGNKLYVGDIVVLISKSNTKIKILGTNIVVKDSETGEYEIMGIYGEARNGFVDNRSWAIYRAIPYNEIPKGFCIDCHEYCEEIDKKEMTISEIEKELGYPIKIVKED